MSNSPVTGALAARLPASFRPYLERGPLAALLLGISSGFPYAMIGATLTTRLAQDGIDKKAVTAFSLAFLVYNLKPELAAKIQEAFKTFKWEGSTLATEFSKSGEAQFIPITYKEHWDVIRKIDAANDVSYACK